MVPETQPKIGQLLSKNQPPANWMKHVSDTHTEETAGQVLPYAGRHTKIRPLSRWQHKARRPAGLRAGERERVKKADPGAGAGAGARAGARAKTLTVCPPFPKKECTETPMQGKGRKEF